MSGHSESPTLVDHLVGELLQRFRQFQSERPGSLRVDNEFELGRLHDRKVGRLCPVENAADVNPHLAKHLDTVG